MPEGGRDLAQPPIKVWRAAARANLAQLTHGCNLYSMGAGGFSTVPAMPNMVRLMQPANPNRSVEQRMLEQYNIGELPTKAQIRRQFGTI